MNDHEQTKTAGGLSIILGKSIFLLNLMLNLLAAQAYADGGVPLWTNRYNGPGSGFDNATAIEVDTNGDVFVTGWSAGSSSSEDYATIKYSSAGVPLWTNRYAGPGNNRDIPWAVAVDGNGDVFVTGDSWSSASSGSADYVTIKYSGAGVPLWTNRYNGPGNYGDFATAVAVDTNGNVFVTGYSGGSGSGLDYATIKYSSAGVPLWTKRYNGPANADDYAGAVVVDGSGNVLVTGASYDSFFSSHWVTIKYSGAGVPLWTNRYSGPGNNEDSAWALAVDVNGNVLVAGSSLSSSSFSFSDYATIKYSGAGVPLWTNLYNGPGDGEDVAIAVAVDGSGNAFVTGRSIGSASFDYATIKYSSEGLPLWTNRYNGGNREAEASAVAVDGSGNVFVTGRIVTGLSSYDYATIAYSGAGVPLWTNHYDGTGSSYHMALVVDRSGNVLVTGGANGSDGSSDYTTIKYSGAGVPLTAHLGFQNLNNQLVLSWTNLAFGLQSAPDLTSTFTNISSATSPYTNPITRPQQYFRLKAN